jgi:hypothetical protein
MLQQLANTNQMIDFDVEQRKLKRQINAFNYADNNKRQRLTDDSNRSVLYSQLPTSNFCHLVYLHSLFFILKIFPTNFFMKFSIFLTFIMYIKHFPTSISDSNIWLIQLFLSKLIFRLAYQIDFSRVLHKYYHSK